MSNLVPWDTLLLQLIANLAVLWGLSMFLGVLVARATQASVVTGLLVGLLLFVGPLVWFLRELSADRALLRMTRCAPRGAGRLIATGGLLVAACLLVIGMFLPWVEAKGDALTYSLSFQGSAADTVVGVSAVVLTAGLLVVAAMMALFSTGRGRAAALVALAGALWLMVSLNAWIMAGAAGQVAAMAESTSQGGASASVEVGAALWLTLAAVTAMFASVLGLMLIRDQDGVSAETSRAGARRAPAAPAPVAAPSVEYGDGF